MSNEDNARLPLDSEYYATPAHFSGEHQLATINEGAIYESTLKEKLWIGRLEIPEGITAALAIPAHRKNLRRKMHYNMSLRFPITGLPSSAFVFIESSGKTKLHYLIENTVDEREYNPHDPMRWEDENSGRNQYKVENLLSRQSLWSGHFAMITPEYGNSSITHMLLLDKFDSGSLSMNSTDKRIIGTLYKNKILPVTSDSVILPQ